jgi:glyoxylate reductase
MAREDRPKVLVTKRMFPEGLELLRAECEVDYHDGDMSLPAEQLRQRARGCQALVTQLSDPIDAALMDAADASLRVIAQVAVGYDNIDVAAATERGVVVTHTPDVLTETTADLTWALMLATARRVVEADAYLREGRFDRWKIDLFCGEDVHGKTLGIVGMGRIGQAVARRARGFGMRVLYHARSALREEREAELAASRAELGELLAGADFVTLHTPLTDETRHRIGREELGRMKRSAILINTARGPVVDESALAEALAAGRIRGAGLDVYEEEPRVHPKLCELSNVVLLPHIGSASWATRRRMCTLAAENALAVLGGRRPPNPVNPEVLEGEGR